MRLYEVQEGKCSICTVNEIDILHKRKKLCVDHCHLTNKVRGLLCNRCNLILGLVKDSIDILNNAIIYLGNSSNGQDANLIHS